MPTVFQSSSLSNMSQSTYRHRSLAPRSVCWQRVTLRPHPFLRPPAVSVVRWYCCGVVRQPLHVECQMTQRRSVTLSYHARRRQAPAFPMCRYCRRRISVAIASRRVGEQRPSRFPRPSECRLRRLPRPSARVMMKGL